MAEAEGDQVSFLWDVPISYGERAYERGHGADCLIDHLDTVNLPQAFDEARRPAPAE